MTEDACPQCDGTGEVTQTLAGKTGTVPCPRCTNTVEHFADRTTGKLAEFLRRYAHGAISELVEQYPSEKRSLHVSWQDLYVYDADLAEGFLDKPQQYHEKLETALQEYDLPHDIGFGRAHVRVGDLPEEKTHSVGAYSPSERHTDYLAVEGQVAKTTEVSPLPVDIGFECQRCGVITSVEQDGPGRIEPHECRGCERQGPFRIDWDETETVDFQLVRIKQPPEEVGSGEGSAIDVRLRDDLVGVAEPGDRARVSGILRFDDDNDKALPNPYLDGHEVEVQQTDFEEIEITDEDVEAIEAIAAGEYGDPLDLLANSIAPQIRGHENIKRAAVLQLFAGVRTEYPNGSVDRGNFHFLLIGDPSVGKSVLLRSVKNLSPRGVYASGKGASAAGMTAAAVRDDFGDQQWTLDAGALVKAHKGVACVDEIDKVKEDAVSSMHDVLSSGTVSVNKAGINTTLPAESALLAAGNPKHGRFDRYETLHEQIDMEPALLSRFDLIFALKDQPDEAEDKKTAKHILDAKQAAKLRDRGEATDEMEAFIEPEIGRDLFRKYVAYARQEVSPAFDPEDDTVKENVEESFARLRGSNGYSEDDPVPVSWRDLDGLVRLSEATAKVYLSDTIEQEHADVARSLIGESLQQFGVDEDGNLDTDVKEAGSSRSQQQLMTDMKNMILELQAESEDGAVERDRLLSEASEQGIDRDRAEHAIEKLKQADEIYEPASAGTDKIRGL